MQTINRSVDQALQLLRTSANSAILERLARLGINTEKAWGVPTPDIRRIARRIGKDHGLAQELWGTGLREACLLATLVDCPDKVTSAQMTRWSRDWNSWEIVDLCCTDLFARTRYVDAKIRQWSRSKDEFVKRGAFVLIAVRASHAHDVPESTFVEYLQIIIQQSKDERNYVKKAVNWALRQIGKRSRTLNLHAIDAAKQIKQRSHSCSARWIASNALREITSQTVKFRVGIT